MKRLTIAATAFLASCSGFAMAQEAAAPPIPVRVVVVTAFQTGDDTGDKSVGEFKNWVQRLPLPETIEFPQGYHHLRYNADKQVLGIQTGEGPVRAAASIMGLGMDPRFDLSHAYFVVAAIAGVDPKQASVGSAAWANYVVDGDLGYEIDARELPATWPTGYVPHDRYVPYQKPVPDADSLAGQQVFRLNPGLVRWAYDLTKDVALADTPNLRQVRARYPGFPNAQKPPFVLIGDDLAAGTFWIGAKLTEWAGQWVNYWTEGKGIFVMTAEEDSGVLQSLTFLAQARRIDISRVLVLRTASDYCAQPPGESAAEFLKGEATYSGLSGFAESLEAAFVVGSRVVDEIAGKWAQYRNQVPGTR